MSEKGFELCSNFSFLTTDTNMTPSTSATEMGDLNSEYNFDTQNNRATVPWPGGTYIIRDPKSNRQITLVDGHISMEPHLGDQGGYHWHCISKDGWLGFRNPSDGLHLGHDNKGNIVANQRHHLGWESFVTRGYPDGGQMIYTRHDNIKLRVISNLEGYKLGYHSDEKNGIVWEFIKV
ncbi:uncharacterized protein GGS22DRAFT_158657 [Annulohypoxylon maeteangense]|uniref:uncharacterized protein n=1 Tax=Annulohypoxylon maeteangense TaxID=1927788 RepID=UPI00200860AD|nr:uncharacterized protein GGS22DRAFT_158657 [Annulohypoxylon maeteangense]KAI0886781.1 hypothetical protein GGS22DRAFT_158657 [Annulohypoxylon maeteangense]